MLSRARPRRWISICGRSIAGLLLTITVAEASAAAAVITGTVTSRAPLSPVDAAVVLHGPPHRDAAPARATIDQRERRFHPRVLVVAPGTTVEFPNNDSTLHNVRSSSSAHRFDLGLYAPGESRSTVFPAPGIVKIMCTAHPEMEAYVLVSDSPHYASVSERGIYRIDGVPPGTYELEVWHPDTKPVTRRVTLKENVPVLTVDVDLPPR
jgi:plastocyanin